MRIIIAAILALTVMARLRENIVVDVEQFFDGFISNFGPWNIDFTACIHDVEAIGQNIIVIYNEAKKMDWKNLFQLIHFIEDALDELKVAFQSIADCKTIPDDVRAIFKAILAITLHDHEMTIIKNFPTIVKDGINFYEDIAKKNFTASGKDIGEIFYILLLAKIQDPVTEVAEFIVGFFDALGVDIPVNTIKGCVKNAEQIYLDLLDVIEDFKTLDLKNLFKVIQAIQKIVSIVQEIMADISTCSAIGPDVLAIINKIKAFDIGKRTIVIISHFGQIVSDITTLIALVQVNPIDTFKLGQTVGNIIDIVIIADSVSVDPDQIVEDFLKGFFDGCGIDIDISEIDECLDDADQIYYDLMGLINDIKGLDFKNFNTMMKVITDIFAFVQDLMKTLDPCADSIPQLQKLIDRVMQFDITKRIPTIIMYFSQLLSDVMGIPTDYANNDWKNLGKHMGNIVYILVLA